MLQPQDRMRRHVALAGRTSGGSNFASSRYRLPCRCRWSASHSTSWERCAGEIFSAKVPAVILRDFPSVAATCEWLMAELGGISRNSVESTGTSIEGRGEEVLRPLSKWAQRFPLLTVENTSCVFIAE